MHISSLTSIQIDCVMSHLDREWAEIPTTIFYLNQSKLDRLQLKTASIKFHIAMVWGATFHHLWQKCDEPKRKGAGRKLGSSNALLTCSLSQNGYGVLEKIRLTELFRPHIGLWVLYIYEIDAISANPHNLSIIHTKRKLGVDPQSEKMIVKNNIKSTCLMKPWYDRTPLGYILVVELSRKHAKYVWFRKHIQLLKI